MHTVRHMEMGMCPRLGLMVYAHGKAIYAHGVCTCIPGWTPWTILKIPPSYPQGRRKPLVGGPDSDLSCGDNGIGLD